MGGERKRGGKRRNEPGPSCMDGEIKRNTTKQTNMFARQGRKNKELWENGGDEKQIFLGCRKTSQDFSRFSTNTTDNTTNNTNKMATIRAGARESLNTQLEHLQMKYVGTGHADTTKLFVIVIVIVVVVVVVCFLFFN